MAQHLNTPLYVMCVIGNSEVIVVFQIIKDLLNSVHLNTIQKASSTIKQGLGVFGQITVNEAKCNKIIAELPNNPKVMVVVQDYWCCITKMKQHNQEVYLLDSLCIHHMQCNAISTILEKIESYPKMQLDDIYAVVQRVCTTYIIPPSYPKKRELENYKVRLEDIIRNYDIIKEQHILASQIEHELMLVPDEYLDEERIQKHFGNAFNLIAKFTAYSSRYYEIRIIDNRFVEWNNEEFIKRHLHDTIFDDISGKSLDTEQRRAILCDPRNSLVVAGAGSGKTLTICGKVKYLIETGRVKNNEIMVLSYSRASANDLATRLKMVSDDIPVETFHSLGLKVLNTVKNEVQTVDTQLEADIYGFFKDELPQKPEMASNILQFIALYFYASEKTPKKYKNKGELYDELQSNDYWTLKNLLERASRGKGKCKTLQREYVRSNEELVIANYLFVNGIRYEYEKPYKMRTSTSKKRQYLPDFYLKDYDIYLEHYGIDREGNAPQYDEEESQEYLQTIEWKRNLHRENNTICIETYSYEFRENTIFDDLKKSCKSMG